MCVALTVGSLALGMPDLLGHGYVDSPFGLALGFAGIGGALYLNARRARTGLPTLNPIKAVRVIRADNRAQRTGAMQWLACAVAALIGAIAVVVLHVIAATYFGA